MAHRDEDLADAHEKQRADTITQIIDEHHDRNGRTIHPARPDDV